jgi:hypothetical protein
MVDQLVPYERTALSNCSSYAVLELAVLDRQMMEQLSEPLVSSSRSS